MVTYFAFDFANWFGGSLGASLRTDGAFCLIHPIVLICFHLIAMGLSWSFAPCSIVLFVFR